MRVLSLFSGIGAFEKALTRKGIPFELVNYCEFDKYAYKMAGNSITVDVLCHIYDALYDEKGNVKYGG